MKAAILQTSRLFLRNLAFSCTEDELRELCEAYGTISQVSVLSIPYTGFALRASSADDSIVRDNRLVREHVDLTGKLIVNYLIHISFYI